LDWDNSVLLDGYLPEQPFGFRLRAVALNPFIKFTQLSPACPVGKTLESSSMEN
jgi:hypothetical protein